MNESIRVSDVLRAFAPAGGWLAEAGRLNAEARTLDAAALGARTLGDWGNARRHEEAADAARKRARLAEFADVLISLHRPEK